MNVNARVEEFLNANHRLYKDMIETCGSVPELLFRIEIYGRKWTQYDWVFFFQYLYQISSQGNETAQSLANDLFDAIDNTVQLDHVITNKLIIMTFIELSKRFMHGFCLKFLAHVVHKFPDIWNMNFMWIRHAGKKPRTHRLACFLPKTTKDISSEFIRIFS